MDALVLLIRAVSLAELPYAVATIYIGEGFGERNLWLIAVVGVAIIAFGTGAFVMLQRRIQEERGGQAGG